MDRADILEAEVREDYENFRFPHARRRIHDFCTNEVSAVYLDAIKDRVYCDGADWPSRRSAQRACHHVLVILNRLCAPILPHTAEEVYVRIPGIDRLASVHLEALPIPYSIEEKRARTAGIDRIISAIRHEVFLRLEAWRKEAGIKDTQDVEIDLHVEASDRAVMESLGDQLPILFKCAAVRLHDGSGSPGFRATEFAKCDRSRLRRADVMTVEVDGQSLSLTERDRRALGLA
jgi:isoleucyl-tRNA synthetase